MYGLLRRAAPRAELRACVQRIRGRLNPHPAGQRELNVPVLEGRRVEGLQHKYRETALYFPSAGQTCHSYCTFCFRWAQFVGDKELRFAATDPVRVARYLRQHHEVTDLLVTGGDPLVMRTAVLEKHLAPLIGPGLSHVHTLRLGTKSLTFWPHRYVTDPDADELLDFLAGLVAAGRHVTIMAHYNHWRELETPMAREAIRRLGEAGVVLRSQGPLLRHINDSATVWSKLWRRQVRLGIVPYYMFVERDTGPRRYFEVPLARAREIYRDAIGSVSGLARTVRGPSMSTTQGKVEVLGELELAEGKAFLLRYLQSRDPELAQLPFLARHDDRATWFDQLDPLRAEDRRFFAGRATGLILDRARRVARGQRPGDQGTPAASRRVPSAASDLRSPSSSTCSAARRVAAWSALASSVGVEP